MATAAAAVAAAIAARDKPVLSAHLRADDGVGGVAARQARAGLRRDRRSRPVFQDAARERDRGCPGTRLSPIIIRFRKPRSQTLDRRGRTRWADAGDDGKGSGPAAQGRGTSGWAKDIVPFAVTLEFDDAAKLRKFRVGAAVSGAREKFGRWEMRSSLRSPILRPCSASPSARPENAAAAPRSGSRRPPADRRSSISARRAVSAHRSPRSAHRFPARSRGNRHPDIAPALRHGPRGRIYSARLNSPIGPRPSGRARCFFAKCDLS